VLLLIFVLGMFISSVLRHLFAPLLKHDPASSWSVMLFVLLPSAAAVWLHSTIMRRLRIKLVPSPPFFRQRAIPANELTRNHDSFRE
jgi:hypothetical protein